MRRMMNCVRNEQIIYKDHYKCTHLKWLLPVSFVCYMYVTDTFQLNHNLLFVVCFKKKKKKKYCVKTNVCYTHTMRSYKGDVCMRQLNFAPILTVVWIPFAFFFCHSIYFLLLRGQITSNLNSCTCLPFFYITFDCFRWPSSIWSLLLLLAFTSKSAVINFRPRPLWFCACNRFLHDVCVFDCGL